VNRWSELIGILLQRPGTTVVATGSPQTREQQRLRDLAASVGHARLRVVAEPLSIPRLAALLSRCALHLGTDSGVTHLAMAMGLPTVSVFRGYEGLEEWRPRGPRHSAAVSPCHCVDRPDLQPDCASAGAALCLARIPVSEVVRLLPSTLRAGILRLNRAETPPRPLGHPASP
jgi:ADP-heptose:LPS heptosyltransferase